MSADVRECVPCDPVGGAPEAHSTATRVLLMDRIGASVPVTDDKVVEMLTWVTRNGVKFDGPITVHKGPQDLTDLTLPYEWAVTTP